MEPASLHKHLSRNFVCATSTCCCCKRLQYIDAYRTPSMPIYALRPYPHFYNLARSNVISTTTGIRIGFKTRNTVQAMSLKLERSFAPSAGHTCSALSASFETSGAARGAAAAAAAAQPPCPRKLRRRSLRSSRVTRNNATVATHVAATTRCKDRGLQQ